MTEEKNIVIHQPWGGLGDNLQFTILPELYSKLGYKVYISSKNAYRNQEIYDLIWKLNPFIEGISDLEPNAGTCKYSGPTPGMEFLRNIEWNHGLTGDREYPLIYYIPKLLPELADCLLYDVTAISVIPTDDQIKNSFQSILDQYPDLTIKKIHYTSITNRDTPYFSHPSHRVNSIYDLCDTIYSCKVFLALQSGAASLASAIKKDSPTPKIYVFHHPRYNNNSLFKFKNVHYAPF